MAHELIPDRLRHHGILLDIGAGRSLDWLGFPTRMTIDPQLGSTTESLARHPDNSVHAVTMLAVLEHMNPARLAHLFAEIFRVLKGGGFLVLTTPPPWTRRLLEILSRLGLVSREEIAEHKAYYNNDEILRLLREAGFLFGGAGHFLGGLNQWAWARK